MAHRELTIVDRSTGEIISDGTAYIRHKSQDDAYKRQLDKERYIHAESNRHWVASYHTPIKVVSKALSLTEAGAILKLIPYMQFNENGRLVKDGRPLNQTEIQRIFKRGKTATKSLLLSLETIGILRKKKDGRSNVYFISDVFHEKGNVRTNERFTKLYQVRAREITDELNLHEAGVLYKVLPYFHYDLFYLCANPNEMDPDKLIYINREELSKIVGLDVGDISRLVSKLKRLKALMSTSSGRSVRYLIHPDLMFRQARETEWTRSVRRMFEAHN